MQWIVAGLHRPRTPFSATALLKQARILYQILKLQWKIPEKKRAIIVIISWTELVAILPTGKTKSLLFMLPYTLPDVGVNILILSQVSLRGDLLRRIKELRINHLV